MKQQKKPTNGQLQRRIDNAVLLIDKTKDTQSIFFSDKGLRLTVNEEYALIETGFHKHVFSAWTMSGASRPYLYTKRLLEIALGNDCQENGGYYFGKLIETLKGKEDKADYNVATYVEWWFRTIFDPLYAIGETEAEAFFVHLNYIYSLAKNEILLSEKTEDITNKMFVERLVENIKAFTKENTEAIILHKKTDEELIEENMKAAQMNEAENILNTENNG